MIGSRPRLAFIVSHPIQYYAPLHQRLAGRDDIEIKVFFTWHGDRSPVEDSGFGIPVAWDIPLTEGYDFEVIANTAPDPGTHHFTGLRNPDLVRRVDEWRPDIVHVTGWAWRSHLSAMWSFSRQGVPILFRGDSHLLDETRGGPRAWLKREVLRCIYSWPTGFLVTGKANHQYYETFGVEAGRLHHCPHSIDVARFASPARTLERRASEWRRSLGLEFDKTVLLFAGKFEPRKCPVELMHAVARCARSDVMLVLVGDGVLKGQIDRMAAARPDRFRVLPFQNQSQMPIVYRIGDLFVLPSSHGETWGLAVNEALACGRPVLVSDHVGCAADAVDDSCGRVFSWADQSSLQRAFSELLVDAQRLAAMKDAAARRAWAFDIGETERGLMGALAKVSTA